MSIPRLDIHSTRAVMEIHRDPMRLTVRRTAPKMNITRTRARFRIANSKQLLGTQVGRRSPDQQRRRMIQQAQQTMIQGIQRTNRDADQYANYYRSGGSNMVAQVSLSNMLEDSKPVYDSVPIPAPLPEMEWELGEMDIEWDAGELDLEWEGDPMPKISVTPHSVEIRLVSGEVIRVGEREAESIEREGLGKRLDKEV